MRETGKRAAAPEPDGVGEASRREGVTAAPPTNAQTKRESGKREGEDPPQKQACQPEGALAPPWDTRMG